MNAIKKVLVLAGLLASGFSSSGCVLVAAAGVGYMAYDEATECDDKFDPLEDVRGKEDGCN